MPIYCYQCNFCEEVFEEMHSIKDTINICKFCKSVDTVNKIPQMPISSIQKSGKQKPGDVTKKFIEEAKEDLQIQKQEMERERNK